MAGVAAPLFTVVIPTYGRPQLVERCLNALARIDPPSGGFEVIVVDDGSPRPLDEVVLRFTERLDVRVLRQRNAGPATARNHGVRSARGRWVAFLDDDCVPEPFWLRGFETMLERRPAAAAGGQMVNGPDDSIYSVASNLLVAYVCGYYNRGETARFFTTANLVCERAAFLEFGGFDESFRIAAAEDRDFCDRWVERGLSLAGAPEAVVHHAPRLSFTRFLRQHFNYGRGACYLRDARQRRGVRRPRLEPATFYARLILSPMRPETRRSAVALIPLMVLTQVAYAIGYYSERLLRPTTDPRTVSRAQRSGMVANACQSRDGEAQSSAPGIRPGRANVAGLARQRAGFG